LIDRARWKARWAIIRKKPMIGLAFKKQEPQRARISAEYEAEATVKRRSRLKSLRLAREAAKEKADANQRPAERAILVENQELAGVECRGRIFDHLVDGGDEGRRCFETKPLWRSYDWAPVQIWTEPALVDRSA
jgi:hypothetical protein